MQRAEFEGSGDVRAPAEGCGGLGSPPQIPLPALHRALAQAGIENPFRRQLAADPHLQPDWVAAWQLWTCHPDRAGLTNPTGYIVRRLQHHDPPPEPYLHLASLTAGQWTLLERAYWLTDDQLDPDVRRALPLYLEIFGHEHRG